MKYTLIINQKQAIELGIKNINQAHIFDLLTTCSTWAETKTIDDVVYYWVARQVISNELPLLKIKPKTVYRHLKILSEIGLIDYQKDGVKDLIRLTKKGKKYHSNTMGILKSDLGQNTMGILKSDLGGIENPHISTTKVINSNVRKTKQNSIDEIWQTYKTAFEQRYKSQPVKTNTTIKQLKTMINDFGIVESKKMIQHYLTISDKWYMSKAHDINTLVANTHSIRTHWLASLNLRQDEQ